MPEAEDGVDLVVVQVQALALAVGDLQPPGAVVLVDLEGQARVHAAEHAAESLLDAVAGGARAGDVLLAVLGRVEVADLAAQGAGLAQGGLFQARGHLLAMLGEVLEGDTVEPEVALQAVGVGEVA